MPRTTRSLTTRGLPTAIAAAVLAAACASSPRLAPAPITNTTPGVGLGATATQAGVTVEARTGAWDGTPANLKSHVTPVLVTITNGSTVPLRVRYNELWLMAADGQRFPAIPPYDVQGTATQRVTAYAYPVTGFTVAPYLSTYYPGLTPVTTAWAYDPLYYGAPVTALRQLQLPTADMVQKALPEGWLAPGGSVGGFVYFQRVPDSKERVAFRFDAVNAGTGTQFAFVSIPFTVGGA